MPQHSRLIVYLYNYLPIAVGQQQYRHSGINGKQYETDEEHYGRQNLDRCLRKKIHQNHKANPYCNIYSLPKKIVVVRQAHVDCILKRSRIDADKTHEGQKYHDAKEDE